MTLYAHWSTTTSNVVSIFYTQQGYFKDGTQMCSVAQEPEKPYKFPDDTKIPPYLTNKDFAGWFTLPVGGTEVKEGDIVPKDAQSSGLFAHWKDQEIKVTFMNDSTVVEKDRVEIVGDKYTFPADPSKPNKTFAGWYTEPNKGGTHIDSSTEVSKTDATILYAGWNDITRTVTLQPQGGTFTEGGSTEPYVSTQIVGDKYSFPGISKANKDFGGWWTDSQLGTEVKDTDTVPMDAPATLYAHWTDKKVTVTFKDAVDGSTIDTKQEIIGDKYVLPVQPEKPYKTKAGW